MIGIPDHFEPRRRKELKDELVNRARVWLPDWRPRDGADDFATALFEIVARLESEVTQRLDKIPQKVFRGFLHWLGVRGEAARAGRLPVVFRMAAGADPVLAHRPIQLQATPAQTDTAVPADPVTFETDKDLMVSRGTLAAVVGVKPALDRFFVPANGYFAAEPPKAGPTQWRLKSDALIGATQLQLEPELGLDALPTLFHETSKKQYRVTKVEGSLATIEPALETVVNEGDPFTGSTFFEPFGESERNRQEHALYIGSESVLNLPTAATIAIASLDASAATAEWFYWGKSGTADALDWRAVKAEPGNGQVTLTKLAGSVEMRDIDGKSSRWLRALKDPAADLKTSSVSRIQLSVNCAVVEHHCPASAEQRSTVAVEAIANTTPLVLDTAFYPLGREPKLFDAFYIGSAEAFSKENAFVSICLEALDSSTTSWAASRTNKNAPDNVLFSVGSDGQLHRLGQASSTGHIERQTTVRPPFNESGVPSTNSAPARLDKLARITTVARSQDTIVALTARDDTWLWSQHTTAGASRWFQLRTIKPSDIAALPNPVKAPDVAVLADGDGLHVIRQQAGKLFETALTAGWEGRDLPQWKNVTLPAKWDQPIWERVSPVSSPTSRLNGAEFTDGWLAVSKVGDVLLFGRGAQGDSVFKRSLAIGRIDPTATPLAIRKPNAQSVDSLTIIAKLNGDEVAAWRIPYTAAVAHADPLTADAVLIGASFDWMESTQNDVAIAFAAKFPREETALGAWFPFEPNLAPNEEPKPYLSQELAGLQGAAALASGSIVAPGRDGDVFVLTFNPDLLVATNVAAADVASALVVERSSTGHLKKDDFIKIKIKGTKSVVSMLADDPATNPDYGSWLKVPASESAAHVESAAAFQRRIPTTFTGEIDSVESNTSVLEAAAADRFARRRNLLVVIGKNDKMSIHSIKQIKESQTDPWLLTVEPKIPKAPKGTDVNYVYVTQPASKIHPLVTLDPVLRTKLDALKAAGAFFRGAKPFPNRLLFVHPPAAAPVDFVIFRDNWSKPPLENQLSQMALITSTIFGELATIADSKTSNPALSWEYWDGSAWWTIAKLEDGTSNLRSTGLVTFCVPPGLEPTDVAGRTNHWIRARLVGGDFGHENVIITSTPQTGHPEITVQTVERSLSGINPPQYASIDLRYSVCCPSYPDHVITTDGGRTRDQTDANRLPDAHVELFVPLEETIRRAASVDPGAPLATTPAIYLGFDEKLEGGPIAVLFLVEEGTHDGAFPLQVDLLTERGFEPVLADDGTRGLNESGVLTFTLSAAPPAIALFASEARTWLRLRPSAEFTGAWEPKIRSAFLNGAYVIAAETQDLERLGSSDGSPGQRVSLARPPVLQDSLELRVREPIGDEEVEALLRLNPAMVRDKLENDQRGPWVLWQAVVDPDDGEKDERIYSIDHDTGEIAFGDGRHGRIPPIGRDNIVAVRYQRGGGDAANRVAAWSQINLITPIPGVEIVVAPDGAAGGADPQTPEQVVRFAPANQYMRQRALTLRDFEMLATQSSPDVAQAHAFQKERGVQLVVVMRGRDPRPSQRVRRELARYLAARTSPMLAAHDAITVVGPGVVRAYVDLNLAIDRIDHSGSVAQEVTTRIERLLDPALGALDGTGWRLGDVPTDTDVAAVLDGIDYLEEIRNVRIVRLDSPASLTIVRPCELVMLAPDGIRFQFDLADVEIPA